MSNFNLSNCIVERDYFDCGELVIGIDSIKEFIAEIEKIIDLKLEKERASWGATDDPEIAQERINKAMLLCSIVDEVKELAGEKFEDE